MLVTDALLMLGAVVALVLAVRGRRCRWAVALAVLAVVAGLISLFRNSWQAAPGVIAALLVVGVAMIPIESPRRAIRYTRRAIASVAGMFALASAALFYAFPIFSLPTPDGPHAVGTRQFELTDPSRTGVMEGAPRRLLVRAWYPASNVEGLSTRPYLTRDEVNDHAIDVFSDFELPHVVYRHFSLIRTHSHVNAPVDGATSLPVVVFSHGSWCWPGQNTALMEKLASHGYLVFSIGHPYDAGTLAFAEHAPPKEPLQAPTPAMIQYRNGANHDDRHAALRQYQIDFDNQRVRQSFDAWRDDLRFFVDQLTADRLPDAASELQDAADDERIGFAGMSFGGTSSASACHHDIRCKAAVNLDGEEFDWSLYNEQVRMPLAVLHADWVRYPPFGPASADPTFNILCGYAYESWSTAGDNDHVIRGRLIGARHLGLTDLPLSGRGTLARRMFGRGNAADLVEATNAFVVGFFDSRLKQAGEPASAFPAAVLDRYPSALAPHRNIGVREWWDHTAHRS